MPGSERPVALYTKCNTATPPGITPLSGLLSKEVLLDTPAF